MAESLAAVSLAGNILQFVGTAKKIMKSTKEIMDGGMTEEYRELEITTRAMQRRVERIGERIADPEDDAVIRQLTEMSKELSRELLLELNELTPRRDHDRLGNFTQAVRIEWKRSDIESLRKRLNKINNSVVILLNAHDFGRIEERLSKLDKSHQQDDSRRMGGSRSSQSQLECLRQIMMLPSSNSQMLRNRSVVAQGLQELVKRNILEQLVFRQIDQREQDIKLPHEKTLEWITDASHDFTHWLQSEKDTYWISGKPGSGKSTLMRNLGSSNDVLQHLRLWAGECTLVILKYYFWNAAKHDLQKSQSGLLRSMLHQLLSGHTHLIPAAFPQVWCFYDLAESGEPIVVGDSAMHPNAEVPHEVPALILSFQAACNLLARSNVKLCAFIDGLDEYDGYPEDILNLVATIGKSPGMKLCVSSRPWNEFEDALGRSKVKRLYMQDFNHRDITLYVHDNLTQNRDFQIMERKGDTVQALVAEITAAAQGVFLWVILVVRSFQEGLRNGDTIANLRRRLRSLPTDLDEYFENILFVDVDSFYREDAARFFAVTMGSCVEIPLMALWNMSENDWFMNDDNAMDVLKSGISQLSASEVDLRLIEAHKRLNACCKGLLEVKEETLPIFTHTASRTDASSAKYFTVVVDFLHRTVRDFLLLPKTRRSMRSWDSAHFNPDHAIPFALLSLIKATPKDAVDYFLRSEAVHGKRREDSLRNLLYHHLRECDSANKQICRQVRTQTQTVYKLHRRRMTMTWEDWLKFVAKEGRFSEEEERSDIRKRIAKWLSKFK